MIAAVNEVLKGRPLNVVPRGFKIDRMTLKRCCCKMKNVHQVIYYLDQK